MGAERFDLRAPAIVLALGLILACAARSPVPTVRIREGFAVTPDSVRIYYRVAGEGPETVLAPFALFLDSTFDTLAVGRRIVTYDPRGRGRSDSVSPDRVSLSTQLLDLETVRRAVGAEHVAVIGWSGGGMETFVYALRHPGRVTRLIQLAPVAPRFEPYGALMMADRAQRTDSAAQAAVDRRIRAGEFRSDPAAECRALAAVSRPALLADPAHGPATPDVCGYPNEYPARLRRHFDGLFRSFDGFDWRDSLAAVGIPRLVIHGARDNTPLDGNEEWVAAHPEARLLVIDGAGHWPHYEQRGRTLAAIATFLAGSWPAEARAIAR
jgi:pimeloyl-ACP methyl ester carboxylesterase